MRGLVCGHFSDKQELDMLDMTTLELDLNADEYCPRCNDFEKIKRVNVFIIEREIPEIV